MKRIKPSSRAKVELSEVFLEVNVQYSVSFLRTRPFLRVNDSFHIQCPNGKLPVSAYSTDPWIFCVKNSNTRTRTGLDYRDRVHKRCRLIPCMYKDRNFAAARLGLIFVHSREAPDKNYRISNGAVVQSR